MSQISAGVATWLLSGGAQHVVMARGCACPLHSSPSIPAPQARRMLVASPRCTRSMQACPWSACHTITCPGCVCGGWGGVGGGRWLEGEGRSYVHAHAASVGCRDAVPCFQAPQPPSPQGGAPATAHPRRARPRRTLTAPRGGACAEACAVRAPEHGGCVLLVCVMSAGTNEAVPCVRVAATQQGVD